MNYHEIDMGEIYYIKNKINGKGYIGQTKKYVGKACKKWGTFARWKSHIREAFKNGKDHCVLLNQAIRKYGVDNFDVIKITDCHIKELDELEIHYIKITNTLSPFGYNLKEGGTCGKASVETRKRMEESRNERSNLPKLPKYMRYIRNNGLIIGYLVYRFPKNENECFPNKYFYNVNNPHEAYKQAVIYLTQLENKKQYIEISSKVNADTQVANKQVSRLPDNIYPIIQNAKRVGFYVEGLINYQGNMIPQKVFNKKTDLHNFNDAKKYIQQIAYINDNKIPIKDWNTIETIPKKNKQAVNKEYLPKYINVCIQKGVKVGYVVNGFPILLADGSIKKYQKKFTKSKFTMEERYQQAIAHLEELKNIHLQLDKSKHTNQLFG
jgi:hypothetical protein